jgi:hypothetical protein
VIKMTVADAYNLIIETVEGKLAQTVKRWGYTVPKVSEDRRVCWLLREIKPRKIISVTDKKHYICLWRPTNYVYQVYPQLWIEPKRLVKWVSSRFVTPAIEAVVVALAKRALRDIEAVRVVATRPSTGTLQLKIGTQTFYLDFRLRKTVWGWKIISERRLSLANIRQPIAEHPINTLRLVARNFGLLIL